MANVTRPVPAAVPPRLMGAPKSDDDTSGHWAGNLAYLFRTPPHEHAAIMRQGVDDLASRSHPKTVPVRLLPLADPARLAVVRGTHKYLEFTAGEKSIATGGDHVRTKRPQSSTQSETDGRHGGSGCAVGGSGTSHVKHQVTLRAIRPCRAGRHSNLLAG